MLRRDLPPKLVQSFLAVLRMQSYTKAAHALNLTQPAISQHIARLEEILGFRLIERSRGVVLPTAEAQEILPDLERFSQSLDVIFDKVRRVVQGGQRVTHIATPTSMVAHLLAPAIMALRPQGVDVFPVFREVDDHRVYDMVRAGEVDFALTSMGGSDADLSCNFLLRDRPCLVFPDSHPLHSGGAISIEDILPFALIRPPANTSANRMISICEQVSGRGFTFSAEASRLMTMEVMARAGLGLLILPALSARLICHSGLNLRPIDMEHGWRSCQLIRQKHSAISSPGLQIAQNIQNIIERLERDLPGLVSRKPET